MLENELPDLDWKGYHREERKREQGKSKAKPIKFTMIRGATAEEQAADIADMSAWYRNEEEKIFVERAIASYRTDQGRMERQQKLKHAKAERELKPDALAHRKNRHRLAKQSSAAAKKRWEKSKKPNCEEVRTDFKALRILKPKGDKRRRQLKLMLEYDKAGRPIVLRTVERHTADLP